MGRANHGAGNCKRPGTLPPDSHPSFGGHGYAHGCAHGHEGKRWARPASWLAGWLPSTSRRERRRLERRQGSHGTPRTAEKALYSAWPWATAEEPCSHGPERTRHRHRPLTTEHHHFTKAGTSHCCDNFINATSVYGSWEEPSYFTAAGYPRDRNSSRRCLGSFAYSAP
jgi:hypothetical protein